MIEVKAKRRRRRHDEAKFRHWQKEQMRMWQGDQPPKTLPPDVQWWSFGYCSCYLCRHEDAGLKRRRRLEKQRAVAEAWQEVDCSFARA